jgi:hypothetical protein
MRRMRALLADLVEAGPPERCPALRREQEKLDAAIARSFSDSDAILLAGVEDRQGIGSPRARRSSVDAAQRGA